LRASTVPEASTRSDPLLEELARSIFAEAERRFGADPLAELWREAANEAACARFESIELGLPPM
jgi:hypothetical protein